MPWKEHGTRGQRPPEGTWDRATRQEVISYRDPPPPVDRMTDASKSIFFCVSRQVFSNTKHNDNNRSTFLTFRAENLINRM